MQPPKYYYITQAYSIGTAYYQDSPKDNRRLDTDNYYLDYNDAVFALDRKLEKKKTRQQKEKDFIHTCAKDVDNLNNKEE